MTNANQVDHADDSIVVKTCPYELLARERMLVLNSCITSMDMKCEECLAEKPQDDDCCGNTACPLFFLTQIFLN
jgi:hypothetical protein